MDSYQVYCMCRSLIGWSKPSMETYSQSSEMPYYEMLKDYLVNHKKLSDDDVRNFLRANYHNNPSDFDPYKLTSSESWDIYMDWCKYKSTKNLYLNEVRKSFTFIENFCINKNIDFKKYKLSYAAKHIRENKIDYAVAVHLQLVDTNNISKIDKLLLKNFLSKLSIVKSRLNNPELSQLLKELTLGMKKLLQEYHKDT